MMARLIGIIAILTLLAGAVRAGSPSATKGPGLIPADEKGLQQPWQTGQYCGVNCLYYLLQLGGFRVDYEEVASQTAVTDKGSSLEDLHQCALRLGMANEVVKATPETLRELDLPVIVHITSDRDEGHYVVLLAIQDQADSSLSTVKIIDGTTCRFEQRDLGYFIRMWSGYVLAPREGRLAVLLLYAIYALTGLLIAGCIALLAYSGSGRRRATNPEGEAERVAVEG